MAWISTARTDTHVHLLDPKTGAVKKVAICSDAQFQYLNSMRVNLGMAPLTAKPAAYKASKSIEACKKKLWKRDAQQKLL